MNFVINGRFLTQELTGVQRFAIQIVQELSNKSGVVTILVPKVKATLKLNIDNVVLIKTGRLKGHLWEQLELPIWLKKNNYPVLLNLCNTAPLVYNHNSVVVHDLAFIVNPTWFSFSFRYYYKFIIPQIIRKAQLIFTVSETVKKQICTLFPESKDPTVIYNAASDSFKVLKNVKKKKIILTVGSIEPRKNLFSLIAGFQKANIPNYQLVIVGEINKNFTDLKIGALPKNIVFTGRISDEQLIKTYNQAEVFAYLSFYEGFGIPPLEAQKCGIPIIVSDIEVFHEIYNESAIYADPYDANKISNAIKFVLTNPIKNSSYSALSLENSVKYSWNASATKIYKAINNYLLNENSHSPR